MVIFGGQGQTGPLNDVWAFDLDTHTWTDLTPTSGSAPAPRFTPASVYDPRSRGSEAYRRLARELEERFSMEPSRQRKPVAA